jgi:hypothetical protein
MGLQISQQPIGWTKEKELIEQDLGPYGNAKNAFGNELGRAGSRDDPGGGVAAAGFLVSFPLDDPAVRFHLDFDHLRVFGARKFLERKMTRGAAALVVGKIVSFRFGRQMGVIPSPVAFSASLLTAGLLLPMGLGGVLFWMVRSFLGFTAKELTFPKAQFGLQLSHCFLGCGLAFQGFLVHFAPIADFTA